MQHLPVHCPRCHETGYVRIDHMDLQLKCKACDVRFHIDSTGNCVIGRIEKRQVDLVEYRTVQAQAPDFDPFGFLARLPWGAKLIFGVVTLALLTLGLQRAFMNRGVDLPIALTDRAIFVSQALVDNDLDRLLIITASGTSKAMKQWLSKTRPTTWGPQVIGQPVDAQVDVIFQDARKGRACLVATVKIPALARPRPDSPGSGQTRASRSESLPPAIVPQLELLLFWSLDDRGEWYLDGQETLEKS